MLSEKLKHEFYHIARTRVTRDVVMLYMLSKRYNFNLLSLLALYEVYGTDVFFFFYILTGNSEAIFMGKTPEEISFKPSVTVPMESNLKLMLTKAEKVSCALRRNSDFGLTSVTLPVYNELQNYCDRDPKSREVYIDFYSLVESKAKKTKKEIKEGINELKRRCVHKLDESSVVLHR